MPRGNCGRSRTDAEQPDAPQAKPPLGRRISKFQQARARWVAAGKPLRSSEEIDRLFAICEPCEHFDGAACRKCGCRLKRKGNFMNKLAWATEACPIGKWGQSAPPADVPGKERPEEQASNAPEQPGEPDG